MKRLLKPPLKAIWRGTALLRRPFLRKLEGFLRRCLAPTEPPRVPEVTPRDLEIEALMDHVVRELVRMQSQVEMLQQAIVELLPDSTSGGLAIAGEIEPGRAAQGPLKAG
jgi:hypothetical protein